MTRSTLVVGTGLVGTSVALALRVAGRDVLLSDPEPAALARALARGAGRAWDGAERVEHAVVAAPPGAVGAVIAELLQTDLTESVSDVASVKSLAALEIQTHDPHVTRYCGGHPMAGSERAGPDAARPDLFVGRPWALTPHAGAEAEAVAAARAVALDCGAVVVEMSPAEHDAAVAAVSHLPHLVASVLAAVVGEAAGERALGLVGQGFRDSTRVAAGSPTLWTDIVVRNAAQLAPLLSACAQRLEALADELAHPEPGPGVSALLQAGNDTLGRLPGKHSATQERVELVSVTLRDRPGELAGVLAAAHQAGVNVEDIRIEHAPGAALGTAGLLVLAGAGDALVAALGVAGWSATVERAHADR